MPKLPNVSVKLFDEAQFRSTNTRVLEHQAKRDALHERFAKALNDNNLDELRQIILDEEIVCPISGTKKLDGSSPVQSDVYH